MLSNDLEYTLKQALSIATKHKHEYATYEHLLLALIENDNVQQLLIESEVAIEFLKTRLEYYVKHNLRDLISDKITEAKPTAGFQRIIQRAALHSQTKGQRVITAMHVLAEFFFEQDSHALICLKEAKLTRIDVLNHIKKIDASPKSNALSSNKGRKSISALSTQVSQEKELLPDKRTDNTDPQKEKEDELEKYCTNLNKKANANSIDCLIGRQDEIQRTIEILCKRKKNNAIFIGEAGVGKTAIAEGLAIRIIKNDVPELLKNATIYSLDIAALLANTKFRGDFEERVKNLLKSLKENKGAILFIDEIHNIIGAGSTTTGALDASNLLKPALARGEIRCIGSTTFKEYHNNFEKDMALVRRFQKIIVSEPDEAASLEILKGLKGYYEKYHNVMYSDSALKAAITLSERYIHDKHLPDKAIDLIDEAGAKCRMNSKSKKKAVITNKEIGELLSQILNIPQITANSDEIKQLKQLSINLKNYIFGQDEAIDALCSSIKLSKAGLRKTNRPTGCYLFTGSTGVGKTELAKQLANFCHMKLLKFDMTEFLESHSISKLLGTAPGYVGFDQEGLLSSEVDKYPYSVVLLDEMEKAHPDIFNILLQIMDEGTLTDNTGKHIDFTHTIVILTTNITPTQTRETIGFNVNKEENNIAKNANMPELNRYFSPELLARLDQVITFNPIDKIVPQIISKNLKELEAQLADKKVRLNVSNQVKEYLNTHCFNSEDGARKLDRVIDDRIKQSIADEILFGKLKNGGTVNVDISKDSDQIAFKFTSIRKSKIPLEVS